MIENPASRLVLICTDERSLTSVLITLFVKLFFPDIFVHLGTSNPPARCVCRGIVAYAMGYDTEQLVSCPIILEYPDLGLSVLTAISGHLSHN